MLAKRSLALVLARSSLVLALAPAPARWPALPPDVAPRLGGAVAPLRRRGACFSSAQTPESDPHVDKVLEMHGALGRKVWARLGSRGGAAAAGDDNARRAAHNEMQAAAFDESASFFASDEATPPEVCPKLARIAETVAAAVLVAPKEHGSAPTPISVVDVGTGTGAILRFLGEAGVPLDRVVGVDLSEQMLGFAKEKYPKTAYFNGDFLEFDPTAMVDATEGEEGPGEVNVDAVVVNACFGNMWNQHAILAHAAAMLREGGRVVLSHPLGADFVEQLKQKDAALVPHTLPRAAALAQLLQFLPLTVDQLVDDPDLYLAVLTKQPFQAMPTVVRLEGPVASGYGRGSRKLGFPTANLPSTLFGEALRDVAAGVYFGWAQVGNAGEGAGRGQVHKAVVNVGWSPTFEGEENPEKIVEAFLVDGGFDKDFYGEKMKLQLIGFQRPELKFPSFPALVAQITKDVEDATAALDEPAFAPFQADPWFAKPLDGGDEAKWDFVSWTETANQLP